MPKIDLMQGDCLELMKQIPDGSVDLVLTDPPYGTMKNIDKSRASKDCGYRPCDWDDVVDVNSMFFQLARILRPNGKAVLFAQEPFTSELILKQAAPLPFSHKAIWKKNQPANILGCKKTMVNLFEDILIFQKKCPKYDFESGNPLREYFLEEREKCTGVACVNTGRNFIGIELDPDYFHIAEERIRNANQ